MVADAPERRGYQDATTPQAARRAARRDGEVPDQQRARAGLERAIERSDGTWPGLIGQADREGLRLSLRERDGEVKGVGVTIDRSDGEGERTFKASALHRSLSAAGIGERLAERSQGLEHDRGRDRGMGVVMFRRRSRGLVRELERAPDPLGVIGEALSSEGHGPVIGWTTDGYPVVMSARTSSLILGVSGSGKTRGVLTGAIWSWPGPVIATTTKPDLPHSCAGIRSRIGQVAVFAPAGVEAIPEGCVELRWSPLASAGEYERADQIAR